MDESFNDLPDYNINGMEVWRREHSPHLLTFCTGDDLADLTIADVRNLIDWLGKALPASAVGEVQK